jgi:hypothetical protein
MRNELVCDPQGRLERQPIVALHSVQSVQRQMDRQIPLVIGTHSTGWMRSEKPIEHLITRKASRGDVKWHIPE